MDLASLTIGARYTRPELARRSGYASHHALGRGVVSPRGGRVVLLFVTRVQQDALPESEDHIGGDLLFWEGEAKHGSDGRIAAAAESGDEVHLFYREIHHTPFEYRGQVHLVSYALHKDRPSRFVFRLTHDQGPEDDLTRCRADLAEIANPTEREEVRRSRLGQGRFREGLMRVWGERCSVTGVDVPPLLTASHIKPWRASTNPERLDPHNGLLLLPQYDRLVDRWLITFAADGRMLKSEAFPADRRERAGVDPASRLRLVDDRHRGFLAYHRATVYAEAGREPDE
jgi:hypothetical protein